jgi:predicted permease
MTVYALLLRLYPAAFRNEYGDEMRRFFERRRRDSGGLGRLLLWLEVIADVVTTSVLQHASMLSEDVRHALRTFRRMPVFALTAILIVALGVGANTAAFTAIDQVFLRPLPFRDAGRLVKIWESLTRGGYSYNDPAPGNYADWKAQSKSFEAMEAYFSRSVNLTGDSVPEQLEGVAVAWGLFPMLGVRPELGRGFTPGEDQPGTPPAVVLSHKLWLRRFGGDPGILGQTILLNGESHRVIGVMQPSFQFPEKDVDLWTAMRLTSREFAERDNNYLRVVGRLKHGVSLDQARAEMTAIGGRLSQLYPKTNSDVGVSLRLLREEATSQSRLPLGVLLSASACVLLIACANLANLLLARAGSRQKEMAMRSVLGAGRERLIRQLLTESLLLAGSGGLAGLLLAHWSLPLVAHLIPPALPAPPLLTLDGRVVTFGFGVALLSGILFGILPALQVSRTSPLAAAREGGREGAGGRRARFRNALVVTEVTVSVVLLVGGGLLVRTLIRLQSQDLGFQPAGVLTLRTALPMPKYERLAQRDRFYSEVLRGVRALPGVGSAGYVSFLPLTMRGGIFPVTVEGQPNLAGGATSMAAFRIATPGYFVAMGIPLRAGRDFDSRDQRLAARTAVVSASLAETCWPGLNPLGRSLEVAGEWRTVAGVVGEIRFRGLERDSEPQVYLPYTQAGDDFTSYVPKDLAIRTSLPPESLLPSVRAIIRTADPDLPLSYIQTLEQLVDLEVAPRRQQLRLIGAFTVVGLALSAVGLYGVLAFLVSQRRQEIGVRVALGARNRDIVRMVLTQGMGMAAIGLGLGLVLALLAGEAMEKILYLVKPYDPLVLATAAGLCIAVALVASFLPARRAASADAMSALRID